MVKYVLIKPDYCSSSTSYYDVGPIPVYNVTLALHFNLVSCLVVFLHGALLMVMASLASALIILIVATQLPSVVLNFTTVAVLAKALVSS